MIGFPSTYQALVDDVLDHRLNRVTVQMEGKNGQGKRTKTYDVDAESVSGNPTVLNRSHHCHSFQLTCYTPSLFAFAARFEDAYIQSGRSKGGTTAPFPSSRYFDRYTAR